MIRPLLTPAFVLSPFSLPPTLYKSPAPASQTSKVTRKLHQLAFSNNQPPNSPQGIHRSVARGFCQFSRRFRRDHRQRAMKVKQQGLDSSFDHFRNLSLLQFFFFRALKLICDALLLLNCIVWLPLAAKDGDQGEHAVREEPVQSHDACRQSRWYAVSCLWPVLASKRWP